MSTVRVSSWWCSLLLGLCLAAFELLVVDNAVAARGGGGGRAAAGGYGGGGGRAAAGVSRSGGGRAAAQGSVRAGAVSGGVRGVAPSSVRESRNVNVGSANVNRNVQANVNRNVQANVNRNVQRNVNVSGYPGRNVYVNRVDNDWHTGGWSTAGSFAAGAAVGAVTGAVVAGATRPSTVVVAPPVAMGTVVTALPGGCTTLSAGGGMYYQCGSTYYQPQYQGSNVVYVVTGPP